MMKKIIAAFVLVLSVTAAPAQEACDELANLCKKYLTPPSGSKGVFVSDGQVYRAFVDSEQEAEFSATFYGGATYRIATSAGSKDNFVIFDVKDVEGNILFSNEEYQNEPYWDFKVESTIDVYIGLRMDGDKKDSGCITMLIGFKQ